jgi:hypothetical protein
MGFPQVVEELHVELVIFHNHDSFGHSPAFPAFAAPCRMIRQVRPRFADKIMRH